MFIVPPAIQIFTNSLTGTRNMTVTDFSTGDQINIPDTNDNFQSVLDKVVSGETISFDELKNKVYDINAKDKVQAIRDELGITIKDNGEVVLRNGITLPRGIANVFRDMTSLEYGKRLNKFADLVLENPRKQCRESLMVWVMKNPSIKILEDGRVLGYRGLNPDFTSKHAGYGIVNGVEYNGHLDNSPGNILEFPIGLADHSTNECSTGLHVGTWEYARDWGNGGKFVTVAFSPADIISPPNVAEQYKLRVIKYEVLEEITANFNPESEYGDE